MRGIRFSSAHTETKPYYLGLDIGVSSIGYAITDKHYQIVRKGRKSLWGARLFEEAQTKEVRRGFRTARRRRKREKQRLAWLKEYFAEPIAEIDPSFYIRMKDSFFYPDDKSEYQLNTLFNDEHYQDADYHNQYPTIYHLREALRCSQEPHDVRLVFLACHHIMKNRGHFLMSGGDLQSDNLLEEQIAPSPICSKSYSARNCGQAMPSRT